MIIMFIFLAIYFIFEKITYKYILLYFGLIIAIALPLIFFFIKNPQLFNNRVNQVSIMEQDNRLALFKENNLFLWQMLYWHGDPNFRHNYMSQPELNIIVFISLIMGLVILFFSKIKEKKYFIIFFFFLWLFLMSLPETMTRQNAPHALRAIGILPPLMIISGFGTGWIIYHIPIIIKQIKKSIYFFYCPMMILLLLIPLQTYNIYFQKWAYYPFTAQLFQKEINDIGTYINTLPIKQKKYVVINIENSAKNTVNIPAQIVVYLTGSYRYTEQVKKNVKYINIHNVKKISLRKEDNFFIFSNKNESTIIPYWHKKFPQLKTTNKHNIEILYK